MTPCPRARLRVLIGAALCIVYALVICLVSLAYPFRPRAAPDPGAVGV